MESAKDGPAELERLFVLDDENYHECQELYQGVGKLEYYRGDFWLGSKRPVVSFRRRVGPVSIINQISETDLFFRRTHGHIRDDPTDLSILWFVRRGTLAISTSGGEVVAGVGDVAVTRSISPLSVCCSTDERRVHEVLHVTVPTHLLQAAIPHVGSGSLLIPARRPELRISAGIFSSVFEQTKLTDGAANKLIDTAFRLTGIAVEDAATTRKRLSVPDLRFHEILRFVEVNLSNPNITARFVADGCGISCRYLSTILRNRNTSLSQLVWGGRLNAAQTWLSTSNPHEISVTEVCYALGFKSPAHFSRSFKRRFGISPKDIRQGLNVRAGTKARIPLR